MVHAGSMHSIDVHGDNSSVGCLVPWKAAHSWWVQAGRNRQRYSRLNPEFLRITA